MQRLVNTVALAAALITLGVGLWRSEGPWMALKRAGVAYIAFSIVMTLLALVLRAGVFAEGRPAAPPPSGPGTGARERGQPPANEQR